jgi:hypothetical protein
VQWLHQRLRAEQQKAAPQPEWAEEWRQQPRRQDEHQQDEHRLDVQLRPQALGAWRQQ